MLKRRSGSANGQKTGGRLMALNGLYQHLTTELSDPDARGHWAGQMQAASWRAGRLRNGKWEMGNRTWDMGHGDMENGTWGMESWLT